MSARTFDRQFSRGTIDDERAAAPHAQSGADAENRI
jgi:hypothetical protein